MHVIVDAPEGVAKPAQTVWEITSPECAIVRLHAHNAKSRSGAESAAEQFQYEHSDPSLRRLPHSRGSIATRVARTVLFNNCFRDVAQHNAKNLASILAGGASGRQPGDYVVTLRVLPSRHSIKP